MRRMSMVVVAVTTFAALPAAAQQPDCTPGRDLVTVPEIKSQNGRLQGVVRLADEQRSVAGAAAGTPCRNQQLRYFEGWSILEPRRDWPANGDPLPGPTLRARVGDLVQLTFLNQVDVSNFPNTLDQAEQGKTDGCDQARATRTKDGSSVLIYPRLEQGGKEGDLFPNCFHGSSTANLHFHGTHTTPSTTGDNVLLYIRPALRGAEGLAPSDAFVEQQFGEIFDWCEANGSPKKWEQLPAAWQDEQKKLLQTYDSTAPYKGVPGALPADMKLWPRNEHDLHQGLWPQYSIGAYPYCFRLPAYDPAKVKMGQSPGTHWYHAHKHGSTALNVGNGMTGAFVIEGEYDDDLRRFYGATPQHRNWGLEERVLVIQQVDTSLNLLSPTDQVKPAPVSVNGRLAPVVTMKPGQVQLWRLVNTSPRSFVQLQSFTERGPGGESPAWRQIAQDGVQFSFANYQRIGTMNAQFNLAGGNRADILVRAPEHEGEYDLQVLTSVSDVPAGTAITLLTVRVRAEGDPIEPPMDFIEKEEDFPAFPVFLADITGPFYLRRELHFNTNPSSERKGKGFIPTHEINDKLFDGEHVDQTMYLDTVEEWTMYNRTVDIAHPFHIHVNPFQVVEIFQPNLAPTEPTSECYVDPLKPATWKACQPLAPPWVWWDVFAIPTARQDELPDTVCTTLETCPADIQQYTACSDGKCKVTIPGYFKMRSRFVDFTGQYVIHCHILAHEDRGMMELVQVIEKPKSPYDHH